MYKSKDDENITETMQDKKMEQKKSGIYMDRSEGKLPQGRVAQHYQDMDAKMEQATVKSMMKDLEGVAGFIGGGGPLEDAASSIKSAYKTYLKPTVDKVVKAKNTAFGANFVNDNIINPVKSELKTVVKKLK